MNQFYFVASLTLFALLPVAILLLYAFGPRWLGAWSAVLIVALLGWFLANASIYFSFENSCGIMESYGNNPPQNIADDCTSDGAARIFGALFGGLYALIYYAPFALIYETARWARRIYRKRRELDNQFPLGGENSF